MDLMREKTIEFRPSLLSGGGGGPPPDAGFECTDRFAAWRLVITRFSSQESALEAAQGRLAILEQSMSSVRSDSHGALQRLERARVANDERDGIDECCAEITHAVGGWWS